MKNQYFGDINDYRKYGLLRLLSDDGKITTAVCWMLTPDDGGTDGRLIEYLLQREKWRHFDPALFDHLRDLVLHRRVRDVRGVETVAILPSCRFAPGLLPDDAEGRAAYFETFAGVTEGCDLIFFDPDNGIEVKSKPYGHKDSSKYLYWHEIDDSFRAGQPSSSTSTSPGKRETNTLSARLASWARRPTPRKWYRSVRPTFSSCWQHRKNTWSSSESAARK